MGKKDDEQSVSSEGKGPLKTFQSLMGEGEKFARDTQYVKAVQSYTEALDLLPFDEDKSSEKDINDRLNALVARSACYLKLGKNDLALQDAEESLKTNKEYPKGLMQKAEALYSMGEFELALMFFHRGKKIRPDLKEFQLGINKAQEAIDNSVGDPHRVKLEASGDLSIFYKNDEEEAKKRKKAPMGYVRASQKKEATVQRKQYPPISNPRTTKQLLGDLYEDRIFLDKIINNGVVTKPNTKTGDAIYQLASEGIDYLDSRTDFWRQQQPMYARTKAVKKPEGDDEVFKHIRRELEAIDNLQNMDQFIDARRRAQHLVDFCDRLDERKFSEKQPALADAYSRLGNAYLELGDYQKALEYHYRDHRIGESKQFTERISRALDNLGRVYARSGQFPQAIQVWEKKIPLANSALEKAWLFHEIGQCQFGLGDYEKAKRHGEQSLQEAIDASDAVWQLNAKVLIAHSQTKLRQYRDAEQTFSEALTLARDQNDVAAERAIERAVRDVRDQIDKGAADSPPDRPETNYEIRFKSADSIIYADDSRQSLVQVTIFGDNGSSGSIDIASGETEPKKFDPRSITIKKKAFDAGKLTKIALTYDNVDSWPLDHIEIADTKRKNKVKFSLVQPLVSMAGTVDLYPDPCVVSFTPSGPGKKEEKKTKPARKPNKSTDADSHRSKGAVSLVDYIVIVQTGSETGSGTDANVFISLNGEKAKIVHRKLVKSESNIDAFEQGKKDTFTFSDVGVGKLKTITLEHDNSGSASGWFVDHVEVKYDNETYTFPVDRWLAKDEGDQMIKIQLEPNKKPAKDLSESNTLPKESGKGIGYVIKVKTGDELGSGTDANVTITLNGEKGTVGPWPLKNSETHRSLFERGNEDVFRFQESDIGKLKSINIAHDDSRIGSAWFLESIEVKANNDTYNFPVGRWLDKSKDDGAISLDLEPNKKPASKKAAELGNVPPPAETTKATPTETPRTNASEKSKTSRLGSAASTPYTVTVHTGNVADAGTTAQVFISLVGDKTTINKHKLQSSADKKAQFEKGSKDSFEFNDANVGKLKNIKIEHDGQGDNAGWYIESVEVKVNQEAYAFPVERWLDKNKDDGQISLTLEPNKKPASRAASEEPTSSMNIRPDKVEYVVTVETGKVMNGGTDAQVTISVFGDKNKFVQHVLDKSDTHRDTFETAQTDVFRFSEVDVGKIKTITIGHNNSGPGSAWYLESVEVQVNDETTKFPVGRWLASDKDDGRISLELQPNKKPESKSALESNDNIERQDAVITSIDEFKQREPSTKDPYYDDFFDNDGDSNEPGAVEYAVTVKTGNNRGANTDANVYLSLYGDKGKVERYHLKQSFDRKSDLFQQGSTDRFQIYEKDIGKIEKIRIEHDGAGIGSGWFLDSIEVCHVSQDQTYLFDANRWLDSGEGDKQISIELEPKKPTAE